MGKKAQQTNDGSPNFLFRHVEKIVLFVVILLVFAFVYLGYSLEGLSASQTPDKLSASAKTAKEHVLNPENWKSIEPTITISQGQREQVLKSQIATNAGLYAWEKPLEPVNVQTGKRREDPKILPPEKLEVTPITAGVAYIKQPTEDDVLALEENSAYEVKKQPRRSRRRNDMYGMDDTAMMGDPAMAGGVAGMGTGMEGMMMDPSMMGMGGMPGVAGGIMANPMDRKGVRPGMGSIVKTRHCVAVKAVVPWKRQWQEYDRLYSNALGFNPMRDIPRYISFTAQRAEVGNDPNAELVWEENLGLFTIELQRQIRINEPRYYTYPPEMADPRYVYPYVFTMPVPPFVDRDIDQLATHSLVPKFSPANMMQQLTPEMKAFLEKKKAEMKTKKKSDDPGVQGIQGMQSMPGVNMGMGGMAGMGGMPGMDGGMGMGMPGMGGMPGTDGGMGMGMGMPGMGMPGMGMPGMDGGMGMGMPGAEGDMSMGMGMGMPGMGMPGMGMPGMGMPGMGDMYGMGMTSMERGPQVDYLLIRFFDFGVEPGRKYRYRVQILIEDPNHPADIRMEPIERFLDDTVKKRLVEVNAEEQERKTQYADKTPLEQTILSRKYYLRSDFSEPSEIVEVKVPPATIAGEISGGRFVSMPKDSPAPPDLMIQTDEPTGKMMAVVHDPERSVDIPGIVDVHRGSVLNFTSNADVIHPVQLVFKKLKDVQFQTNRLVADIRGGMELPETKPPTPKQPSGMAAADMAMGMDMGMGMATPTPEKSTPLYTFGEYAVVDPSGKLHVYNEFEDWKNFKRLALPPQPDTAGMGMGGMPGDVMPGMEGAMPGDEGPRRRGR